MPLAIKIAKLEDVAEEVRSFYIAKDGEYVLDLSGYEDPTGLKSALDSERNSRRDAEQRFNDSVSKFKGIDPEAAREALKIQQDLDEQKLIKEGDLEGMIANRMKAFRTESDTKYSGVVGERDVLRNELHKLLIKTQVQEAASSIRTVKQGALSMIIGEFEKTFSIDDKGQVVAKDDSGNIIYGADGTSPLKIAERMQDFVSTNEYMFEPSKGGGGQGNGDGQGNGNNVFKNTDTAQLSGAARMNLARDAEAS